MMEMRIGEHPSEKKKTQLSSEELGMAQVQGG